jgi:DNA-binding CsgD family transcriptional regulator
MLRFVPLDAFEHASHAALVADAEGRVRVCNRPAAALLGCDSRSALGKPCWLVARFRTREQAPFCAPDCPIQRQARAGELEPFHHVVAQQADSTLDLEPLTFLIPPPRAGRYAALHILWPVDSASRELEGPLGAAGRGPSYDLYRLSRREMEVLQLLASGLRTSEIASRLFISRSTVRNHVQRILRKLQVRRRCLDDDAAVDRFDDLSPDHTECIGGWFYLVRQSTDADYGAAYPGGEGRIPGSGGCP